MNLILHNLDGTKLPYSRKEKKEIKKKILEIVRMVSITPLTKVPLKGTFGIKCSSYGVYSENSATENVSLFNSIINQKTNYFIGQINNAIFLVEVGELLDISGEYHIHPDNQKRKVFVKLKY